jgi:hypothetical protein
LEILNPPKQATDSVKKVKAEKTQSKCKFCGFSHKFGMKDCPAYGKTCDYCKKANHFKSVCLKKAADENSDDSEDEEKPKKKKSAERETKKPEKPKKVKKIVNDEEDSSDSDTFIIRKTTSEAEGVFAILKLNVDHELKLVRCQMDTGSECNLIGLRDLKKLIKNPKWIIIHCYLKMPVEFWNLSNIPRKEKRMRN